MIFIEAIIVVASASNWNLHNSNKRRISIALIAKLAHLSCEKSFSCNVIFNTFDHILRRMNNSGPV